MRLAVLVFPGTWSDWDCVYALEDLGQTAKRVWHRESSLDEYDGVILPGGFSYGDHLRCGAIARFSPVMSALERFAATGKPIFGSCNGFQILCEAGLLPGVLLRNASLQFRCQPQDLSVERADTGFTSACAAGQIVQLPISHGEGTVLCPSGSPGRTGRRRPSAVSLLRRQPQRILARYRGDHQSQGQCAGHDAPPRARLRPFARRRRWKLHLALDH